jgi:hypothetical protein
MTRIQVFSIYILLLIVGSGLMINAQQLPNTGFENWTHYPGRFLFRSYDQPEFWATGNSTLETIPGIDAPTSKTTDARSGTYAAMLVTSSILGQIAPGNLYLGSFELRINNPLSGVKLGIPFREKPSSFSIWYKYKPVDGDSCILAVYLVRRNKQTGLRETLGSGELISKERKDAYVKAEVSIRYDSIYEPDSIIAVFSSSAGMKGEISTGNAGSTLFVDDFELQYEPLSIGWPDQEYKPVYPNPAQDYLRIGDLSDKFLKAELIDIGCRKIPLLLRRQKNEWEADIREIPEGRYALIVSGSGFNIFYQVLIIH